VGAGQIGGPRALRGIEKALDIPEARAPAAWSLGFVGDAKAVAALEKAVPGENKLARRCAAMAAGMIATEGALPALETLVTDPDAEVRATTAWALAQVGGPKALALLAKVALDSAPDPKAKVKADVGMAVRCAMAMIGGEREWTAVRKENGLAGSRFLEMLATFEDGAGSFRYWDYVTFAWE